jgi:GNAT superfamily N-acetyltransferase
MACWLVMALSSVRPATAADAPMIARLQLLVWKQAYSTLLPAGALATDPAEHARSWSGRIDAGGPVLVAMEGTEPVGFAAVSGEADWRDLLDPVGEVEVLHVVPRWGRRGHGGRLLAAAAAELRRMGARSGHWWVPERDPATARFLSAAGWAEDGVRRELETGTAPIVELRWSGTLNLVAI